MTRDINDAGLAIIKDFEKFRPRPYLDWGGVPTIGYGSTVYSDGRRVKITDKPITLPEALQLLKNHLREDGKILEYFLRRYGIELNDNQFSALLSFGYNNGIDAVVGRDRSVCVALRNGRHEDVCEAMRLFKWGRYKGKKVVLGGLVRRREAEVALYVRPVDNV